MRGTPECVELNGELQCILSAVKIKNNEESLILLEAYLKRFYHRSDVLQILSKINNLLS